MIPSIRPHAPLCAGRYESAVAAGPYFAQSDATEAAR